MSKTKKLTTNKISKKITSIKWMWPVHLSKNPGTMMDSIISTLHQFNVINADKYDEFKEFFDE